ANARYLSDEAIKDIKTSFGRVPNAINTMAKKYHISVSRAKEYIENSPLETTLRVINNQLENRPEKESEFRCSASSLNHGSSDRQIKKRQSKPKSIRVSDLSTISNTKLEQVLNKGEKQIE
ncbi:18071_t:CDS:2, partial [Gigaspora margarita]